MRDALKGTRTKKHQLISKKSYDTVMNGGRFRDKEVLDRNIFTWEKGVVKCALCNYRFVEVRKVRGHHENAKKHQELVAKLAKGGKKLYQDSVKQIDPNASGSTLDDAEKEYRVKCLISAAKCNIPLTALVEMSKDVIEGYAKQTIGDASDLVRRYAGPVLATLIDRISSIVGGDGVFDEFSLTFDGTPAWAEAEAIIVTVVTKNGEIIHILIRCGTFEKKLNNEQLKQHLMESMERVGLDPKNWLSSQQDRASVNQACIKRVHAEESKRGCRPAVNSCTSHTLSNGGKKVLDSNGSARDAHDLGKSWMALYKHPGGARDIIKKEYGESPISTGGVRFFNKFEQQVQMHMHGVRKCVEIAQTCVKNKFSEESAKSFLLKFNPDTRSRAYLAMAAFQNAVVSEGLKPTAAGCYNCEGDGPLILMAHAILGKVADSYDFEKTWPLIEDAASKALPSIQSVEKEYQDDCNEAQSSVDAMLSVMQEMKEKIKALDEEKESIKKTTSRSGRRGTRTVETLTEDDISRLLEIASETAKLNLELKRKRKEDKELKEKLSQVESAFTQWQLEFPYRTLESLVQHGKDILKPAADYFYNIFQKEDGECHHTLEIAEAAQMFNPIFLAGLSDSDVEVVLHDLAEKLKATKFKQFESDTFMRRLKEEMPKVLNAAKRDHGLDKYAPSRRYKTRLQRRIRRLGKDESELDWKEDGGEYAERIWQWWKARKKHYPMHYLALRLIVLIQLSSCSVERVFSKLKEIRDAVGDRMLEDISEIRLLLQCNGDLDDYCDIFEGRKE